jgi:hypothetical protein
VASDAPGDRGGQDSPPELVKAGDGAIAAADEPPVVARLIVEIRSDGSRTIARGALEDVEQGQRAVIEARGDSPLQLAWSLARVIAGAPALARQRAKALLESPRRAPRSRLRRWLTRQK